MIEKTIFQMIQKALKQEELLKALPLKTYAEGSDATPYLLYDVHSGTEQSLDFSIHIVSAYKGLAEVLSLKLALVELLEKGIKGIGKQEISFKFKDAQLKTHSQSNTQSLGLHFRGIIFTRGE